MKQQDLPTLSQNPLTTRHNIKSLKAKYMAERTFLEKLADWMTDMFGSIPFLTLNVLWFAAWIIINQGSFPSVKPFDPFPYGLLTMIVSLEAIVLSTFVLISQNRMSKIESLREELDLHVDVITESELTKVMKLNTMLLQKIGIDLSKDKELEKMLKPLDKYSIEKSLEKQV